MASYKRIFAVILAAVLTLGATACGSGTEVENPSAAESLTVLLVQGNLDEIYLGKFSQEYLDLIGSAQAEAQATYEEGLSYEAEKFAAYFDIDNLSDPLKAQIADLYREIYSYAHYTVSGSGKVDDNTYTVSVTVEPINIVELAIEDKDAALADFSEKYADADIASMTEEEYAAYDADWAQAVIAMVQKQLPFLGYKPSVSLEIQVTRRTDGLWQISREDVDQLDAQMIYYPDLT